MAQIGHCLSFLAWTSSFPLIVSAYVVIPWQTQRYYGFDGPWQAVNVDVGGFMSTGMSTSVDLLPVCEMPLGNAPLLTSYIITSAYCSNITTNDGIAGPSTGQTSGDVSCPAGNGTVWTASNGDTFRITCGIDHYAGNLVSLSTDDFSECIESCANTPSCVNVAYSGSACYLKQSIGTAVYDGSWDASLVPVTGTTTTICQTGGGWDPGSNQTASGLTIPDLQTLDNSDIYGPVFTGRVFAQNLGSPAGAESAWIVNSYDSVAVTEGFITLPNLQRTPLEIGFLAIGGGAETTNYSTSTVNNTASTVPTWNLPGGLYNQNQTQSNSFSLQIGSALFNYSGSLVFGGYDKGRAIGPAVVSSGLSQQLLDIEIGVEVGSSPFPFAFKDGILNASGATAGKVTYGPHTPYLHLPAATCDYLATQLPITYDVNAGYYLWNNEDQFYKTIVSSPSYLGFVLAAGDGNQGNITIKVPFALLNLQLGPPAISTSLPYFPIVPYDPPTAGYMLGRAFLQAAAIGRNENSQTSWIAQAPGPGASGQGLGSSMVDMAPSATAPEFELGDSLFAQSWAEHWTPVSNAVSSSHGSGVSAGGKAGIAVGCVLGGLALLGAGIMLFILRRREQKKRAAAKSQLQTEELEPCPQRSSPTIDVQSWDTAGRPPPSYADTSMFELPAETAHPSSSRAELQNTEMSRGELPGSQPGLPRRAEEGMAFVSGKIYSS